MEFQSSAVSGSGVVSAGWEMIKDRYWPFLGMYIVLMVLTFMVSGIFGAINQVVVIGLVFATNTPGQLADPDPVKQLLPTAVSMVISLFTNVIVYTVFGILACGFFKALSQKMRSGEVDFGLLFTSFDKWKQCAVFAVAHSIFQFTIGIVSLGIMFFSGLGMLMNGGLAKRGSMDHIDPAVILGPLLAGMAIMIIVSIIWGVLTTYVYPLIALRDLSGADAMILSARAGFSNFGGLFAMLFILGILMFAGALACLVGLLFVLPIMFAAQYQAYRDTFGDDEDGARKEPPPPPVFSPPEGFQPGY